MKKLLVHMKEYRFQALLGPLFKLLEAIFELFVPLLVADIIDVGIQSGDREYVLKRTLLMVLLGLIGFASALTAQFFAAKSAVGFATNLRRAMFERIQRFSFTDLDNIGASTLITRITGDINQIQTGVNLALRLLLRSPFIVFGALIMAFRVDVKCSLIFLITIAVLSVIVGIIMSTTVPMYKRVQEDLDRVTGDTRESLRGVRVIRAFGLERDEEGRFSADNERLTRIQLKVGRIASLMNPLTYVVVNSAVIAIIYVGGSRVYSGALTTGAVIALYNYMSQILVELLKMANMVITLNKSLASASRVESVLFSENHVEPGIIPTDADSSAYIEFNHVSFTYDGAGAESLSDISFSVRKGDRIGIIGPTGSGKSTLISLLPRFYACTKGALFVDGRDVKSYDIAELRRKIGIVMQKNVLFKGSIRENLLLGGRSASDDELNAALHAAQALDVVEKKGGLDAQIEQGGRNLSGGQKQRLTIARALVGNPEIIIMDDSASALDFATEAGLRKAITALPGNPTVFTVSQRVSSVMYADKIIVLEDGRAVGIGTHDELMKSCEAYAEICRAQLEKEA